MKELQANEKSIKTSSTNASINYTDFGKSEVPVIFIHGFPFDKSSWEPQITFLKTKHRVIAYDIRGFGKSTTNDIGESINLFADDLIGFMDSLKIGKAIICGLSMGGYIALNVISRFPERFEAIILCDTQCIADSTEAKEKRKQTIAQINGGGLDLFTDTFLKNIFCRNTLENKKEIVDKIRKIILSTSTKVITGTLRALALREESCSKLEEIKVPALIICGKEDIITPPAQAEFLNSKIKNSVIHIIDKAGHMSNLEQPDVFNKHLNNFLKEVTK